MNSEPSGVLSNGAGRISCSCCWVVRRARNVVMVLRSEKINELDEEENAGFGLFSSSRCHLFP